MSDILDRLKEKNDNYLRNVNEINQIERENYRIVAAMCEEINHGKEDILTTIKENENYLKMFPMYEKNLNDLILVIDNGKVNNFSQAETIMDILSEIELYNNSKENGIGNNNVEETSSNGFPKKVVNLVKGELKNGN